MEQKRPHLLDFHMQPVISPSFLYIKSFWPFPCSSATVTLKNTAVMNPLQTRSSLHATLTQRLVSWRALPPPTLTARNWPSFRKEEKLEPQLLALQPKKTKALCRVGRRIAWVCAGDFQKCNLERDCTVRFTLIRRRWRENIVRTRMNWLIERTSLVCFFTCYR